MIPHSLIDKTIRIYFDYPTRNCMETIPFTAARTHITDIQVYGSTPTSLGAILCSVHMPSPWVKYFPVTPQTQSIGVHILTWLPGIGPKGSVGCIGCWGWNVWDGNADCWGNIPCWPGMKGCPMGCVAKGGLKPAGCMPGWPIKPLGCIPAWGNDVLDVGGACQFGPPVLLCGGGAVHWCCDLPDEPFRLPLKDNESTTHKKKITDKAINYCKHVQNCAAIALLSKKLEYPTKMLGLSFY